MGSVLRAQCRGAYRWPVIVCGAALCILACALNVLVWTVGMAVPIAVAGIFDLALFSDGLAFVAVLSVANTNRVSITLKDISFATSLETWNETFYLGDGVISQKIKVSSLVEKEEQFLIQLAINDPFLISRIERIFLNEKFYFLTKGQATVQTDLYSHKVTVRGSEVYEKFNRTLIPTDFRATPNKQKQIDRAFFMSRRMTVQSMR